MGKTSELVRGAASNWVALALSFVVTFFLSPFVVHHLGASGYGVWSLVISTIAYMGLLDLGLRGAVMRFVARHHAAHDHDQSSLVVSVALTYRIGLGLVVLTLSGILAYAAPLIFKIPDDLTAPAQAALLLTGISFAVTLTGGVFGAVLGALHRFDLLSATTMAQTVLRAIATLLLLRAGYGITALAVSELAINILANVAIARMSTRAYPQIRIALLRPPAEVSKKLWTYSSWIVLINLSYQVIYYTDTLVVGAVISAAAVTYFAIGGGLIEYLRQIVSSLTTTFMPMASRFESEKAGNHLHQLLLWGTRSTLFVALPVVCVLFFRGKTFIALWMGNQYAEVAGTIMQILVVGHCVAVANATSGNIIYGLGRQKPVAFWTGAEAFANLISSVVLAQRFGVYGVAFGTVVPSLIVNLLLWPRFITRVLEFPLWTYLWQAWGRMFLSALPFTIVSYYAERLWPAASLKIFFLQVAVTLPVYLLSVMVMFHRELRGAWFRRRRSASKSPVDSEQAVSGVN